MRSRRLFRATRAGTFAVLTALIAGAVFAPGSQARALEDVDLDSQAAREFVGGHEVAAVGDINGDERRDLAIVAGSAGSSRIFVVFSTPGPDTVDLNLGMFEGFTIYADTAPGVRLSVAGVDDLNEDGLDDLIVATPSVSQLGRSQAGTAYVIYGTASNLPLALSEIEASASKGFRIDGAENEDFLGWTLDGVGDVNDDGGGDLALSAPLRGSTYVIFGRPRTEPLDLAAFNAEDKDGFVVRTRPARRLDGLWYKVAGLGDSNGDGRDDLIIGVLRMDFYAAHVVWGRSRLAPVDARSRHGRWGYRISGATASVSGAGDVNADGRADILIYGGNEESAYVVFGRHRERQIDVYGPNLPGFKIRSEGVFAGAWSLSSAGDFDGDGFDDVLLGAHREPFEGRVRAGLSFLIYGKSDRQRVNVARLGPEGLRIGGAAADHLSGTVVAGLGDVNDDGLADVLIGAPGAGPSTFLVHGR